MRRRILLSPPDVGPKERTALLAAFDGGWIAPAGPDLNRFEEALARRVEAESCVALSSGSAAFQLSLLAVGVRPGDEVIVQTATFAASAFAVANIGATPVFCDVERATWCLDPDLLDRALTSRHGAGARVTAVMPVDLYGFCPRNDLLREVCDRHGVPVVEDAAEALGSSTATGHAGTLGDLGVLSFNGNKIITTSGGGAVLGPAAETERIRHLATQARQPTLHYEHHEIGHNQRMSNLLAALGVAQLESLDEKIRRRRAINHAYRTGLPDIEWLDADQSEWNAWLSVGLLPPHLEPTEVCRQLDAVDIEARPAWKPMHQQPVFAGATCFGGEVADLLFRRGICLPSGSAMTDTEIRRVIEATGRILAGRS